MFLRIRPASDQIGPELQQLRNLLMADPWAAEISLTCLRILWYNLLIELDCIKDNKDR